MYFLVCVEPFGLSLLSLASRRAKTNSAYLGILVGEGGCFIFNFYYYYFFWWAEGSQLGPSPEMKSWEDGVSLLGVILGKPPIWVVLRSSEIG